MKKFKYYFFILLYLLVLVIVILNLYYTLTKKSYSVVSNNVISAFLALYGYVSGVRYINSGKSKITGIILVSLTSVTIFLCVQLIFFKIRFSI
jgi:hypothetical protein